MVQAGPARGPRIVNTPPSRRSAYALMDLGRAHRHPHILSQAAEAVAPSAFLLDPGHAAALRRRLMIRCARDAFVAHDTCSATRHSFGGRLAERHGRLPFIGGSTSACDLRAPTSSATQCGACRSTGLLSRGSD